MSTIKLEEIRGQRGQIYAARKGHAVIICLDDGRNYMIQQSGLTAVTVADDYWIHSIEWFEGLSAHLTWGIKKSLLPLKHKAEYLSEPTSEMWDKLESLGLAQNGQS